MMRQWSRIKAEQGDCIVLFRLGDFYEAFHEDAARLAEVCDVVLTSRPVRKGERVPMAGVPYHAVDGYIAQLVRSGLRVAIVEQTGSESSPEKRARMTRRVVDDDEPAAGAAGRGIMDRAVVRVVTPGTLVEGDLIEPRSNSYLAACVAEPGAVGLAHADLTTGDFRTTQFAGAQAERELIDELVRLRPAELVVAEADDGKGGALGTRLRAVSAAAGLDTVVTPWSAWRFDPDNAKRALREHFAVGSLAAYGCADLPQAATAAGVVLAYAEESQRGSVAQLRALATYATADHMVLDASTRRNLELVSTLRGDTRRGTLLSVLDRTLTPMGARRLRQWLEQPLIDSRAIEERLDAVEFLVGADRLRGEVRALLRSMPDVERLVNRVIAAYASPRELLALARGLETMPRLAAALAEGSPPSGPLERLFQAPTETVAERIRSTLADDPPMAAGMAGVVRPGFSTELDQIHESVSSARAWIAELEVRERERSGIARLKVGFNKVFGYYLAVPRSQADRVPVDYERRQTLADAERYVTPDLKMHEAEVLGAEERIVALEREIFAACLVDVGAAAQHVLAAARDAALLDGLAALAEVAVERRYTRPRMDHGRGLEIVEGRHPVVEALRPDVPFVPNDITMADGEILLLTGPNMAGKSTVGRQVALIVLLAHIGSFVPATGARIGLTDRIFTRVGAQDELTAGHSTFMVEMVETAGILNHASPRSLIVLDELGRGTSTYDGIAIAWSVVERIHDDPRLGARTLFATHYHELTVLEDLLERVRNVSMAVAETDNGVAFLHRVVPGAADRSYGVHVAELAGLPREVVDRAWAILARLEAGDDVPLQNAGHRPPPAAGGQLPLFAPVEREHPALEALRALDPDRLSPLEALVKLAELRRMVGL